MSNSKRAFILIPDMMAGHWADGSVSPITKLPYPNVLGYQKAGLLPTFDYCMKNGIYAYSWNYGTCNTFYAQRYLATGVYDSGFVFTEGPGPQVAINYNKETILQACKRTYPDQKIASFASECWTDTGWWKAADCTMGFGSYYSDFITTQSAFNWMMSNSDWNMVLLYLAQYDLTSDCPVYEENAAYTKDKHHSLLEFDRYLWMVKTFIQEQGWWDDTYLFIGSDHGCHVGCDAAVAKARELGVPEEDISNYCTNHHTPFDCYVWDFEKNEATDKRSDCCRRTTFIVSGGALAPEHHGKIIEKADIIDFAPTIADAMNIDFKADGRSVLGV